MFDILHTVAMNAGRITNRENAVIALAYSMLMFARNRNLSAMQHLQTLLAVRGHANDAVRNNSLIKVQCFTKTPNHEIF